jgi:hypothetical protein
MPDFSTFGWSDFPGGGQLNSHLPWHEGWGQVNCTGTAATGTAISPFFVTPVFTVLAFLAGRESTSAMRPYPCISTLFATAANINNQICAGAGPVRLLLAALRVMTLFIPSLRKSGSD